MAYIEFVNENEATGTVADDYAFLSGSYSKLFGAEIRTPAVYRTSSLVPAYFRFGAVQNRVATHDGQHDDGRDDALPTILVNFAVAMHSACFY